MYHSSQAAIIHHHPDDKILSYVWIKSKIAELSRVIPIVHHMCINSCAAFTGPFSNLVECPICHEACYIGETKSPWWEFHIIPIGPQLQALWHTEEGAWNIWHWSQHTAAIIAQIEANEGHIPIFDDVYNSSNYLEAIAHGDITSDDMVPMFSIDGAQLYQMKVSNCWISIWIVVDHSPDLWYKKNHVFLATFIPGLNKLKHPNSFVFLGLYHLVALQKEGLMVWDAVEDRLFKSYPYLLFAIADGPGMTYLNGLVGHSGVYGCRLYCPTKGHHKTNTSIYYPYPALLLPTPFSPIIWWICR